MTRADHHTCNSTRLAKRKRKMRRCARAVKQARDNTVARNNRSRLPCENIRIIARVIRDHHTHISGIFNTRFEYVLRQTLCRFSNRPQIDTIGTRPHLAPNTARAKLDMGAKSILEFIYILIFNKQLNFRYKIGKFRFNKPLRKCSKCRVRNPVLCRPIFDLLGCLHKCSYSTRLPDHLSPYIAIYTPLCQVQR